MIGRDWKCLQCLNSLGIEHLTFQVSMSTFKLLLKKTGFRSAHVVQKFLISMFDRNCLKVDYESFEQDCMAWRKLNLIHCTQLIDIDNRKVVTFIFINFNRSFVQYFILQTQTKQIYECFCHLYCLNIEILDRL